MSILGGIAGNLAGGNIGRAVVSLVLDTTGYTANLEKAKAETVATTETSSSAFASFGGAATAAYGIAAVAAVDFAKQAVQAAEEHEQVLAALKAQVGDNTVAFEDQATALQNLSGFQDEAILSADTILSRYKLTEEQVRATIPAILDLARAQGVTVPEAAGQFGKAVLGNTRALKALGISSEEYVVTGNRAADAAKLVELLNKQVGGQAAAYAQTFAGKMEILSAKFDDIKEAIGTGLLDDLTGLANDAIITTTAFEKLSGALTGVVGGFGGLGDALNLPGIQLLNEGMAFLDEKLHITEQGSYDLNAATAEVQAGLSGMSQEAYDAAAASAHLSSAQQDLKSAVQDAGDGILSLTTTVKETFNISQREMQHGFNQMLAASLRFKSDMRQLENLKVGLAPNEMARFEAFMADQGPGYVDAFVNASRAKQREWVADWQASVAAINRSTAGIKPVSIQVDSSQLAAATAKAQGLERQLDRLS